MKILWRQTHNTLIFDTGRVEGKLEGVNVRKRQPCVVQRDGDALLPQLRCEVSFRQAWSGGQEPGVRRGGEVREAGPCVHMICFRVPGGWPDVNTLVLVSGGWPDINTLAAVPWRYRCYERACSIHHQAVMQEYSPTVSKRVPRQRRLITTTHQTEP